MRCYAITLPVQLAHFTSETMRSILVQHNLHTRFGSEEANTPSPSLHAPQEAAAAEAQEPGAKPWPRVNCVALNASAELLPVEPATFDCERPAMHD